MEMSILLSQTLQIFLRHSYGIIIFRQWVKSVKRKSTTGKKHKNSAYILRISEMLIDFRVMQSSIFMSWLLTLTLCIT